MVTMIGTEVALPTLVEDFLRLEIEGRSACLVASSLVANPDARALLHEALDVHEAHLAWLRSLAEECGANLPAGGTDQEASRVGGIRLAHERHRVGHDRAVLAAVASAEMDAVLAYQRILRGTALTAVLQPAFERARGELARQARQLDEAARPVA